MEALIAHINCEEYIGEPAQIEIKSPFVMTICAPTGQGKTYFTVKFLKNHPYAKAMDYKYFMSPSLNLNHDYDDFRDDENTYFYDHREISDRLIEDIVTQMSECKEAVVERERERKKNPSLRPLKCPTGLIVLDDCLDSGLLHFGGVLEKVAERGRHFNLSLIICSQRISGISRSIRINSKFFMSFSCNVSEEERFVEDFVSRKQRKAMYEIISRIGELEYTFFFIDTFERNKVKRVKVSNADLFIKGEAITILFK